MTGFVPAAALAQEPGETGVDDADEAAETPAAPAADDTAAVDDDTAAVDDDTAAVDDEVTQEELDEAAATIEEAERQLEEAKRQMELMGRKMAPAPTPVPGTGVGLVEVDGRAKKLQVSLNDDGTLYFRFAMWLQVWARGIQNNPGTTVLGKQENWYGDVGIRRARFLAFGKIAPRTFMLMHIGINNQTFRNARKPGLYFHDAWVEFEASK